jgi:hypothetical protein
MHPYHHPLFSEFIVYFNENEDYFECHEVLEEYWKSLENRNKAHPLTAFILLSTAMYHWRRGNFDGALRTLRKAERNFKTLSEQSPFNELLNFEQLQNDISKSLTLLNNRNTFQPFKICIRSSDLQQIVKNNSISMNLLPFGSDSIIHKHMLRDRTDILKEREEKKKGRSY